MKLPDYRRLRLWLFAMLLLFGQATMLAHGSAHTDADEAGHACLVCVAAHNVDGPVPPATSATRLRTDLSFGYTPAVVPVSASVQVVRRLARGPPLS
ncbi:MAG: hypothetical protein WC023_14735 [Rhodocyclaceae bacterium]